MSESAAAGHDSAAGHGGQAPRESAAAGRSSATGRGGQAVSSSAVSGPAAGGPPVESSARGRPSLGEPTGKPALGFLGNLYQGSFRPELYYPYARMPDEGKIRAFLQRFREAVQGYEPRRLEQLHAVPPQLMAKMAETGIFGLTISQQYGGLGFTTAEYLRVIEELAGEDMSLAIIPLAHLSIGLKGIQLFGSEEQKRRYLPRAASGGLVFAYALTEPDTGSDAQHIRTRATLSPDGASYLLEGTKTYITNGNYAGAFTVFAQLDPQAPGTMGAFIVERGWEGVKVGADMPKMGLAVSSTTPIQFRQVQVPRENLIGNPGDGFRIAMTILNYGRLGLGASAAGLMARSLEDMRKRASSRRQFGVPIRQFELVQEKMVQARAHGFAAAAMTYHTAALLDRDPLANVMIESSHVKLYGTTRAWHTLNEALQTAGGSGYLATLPYEKRIRDFRVTTVFEGTTEIHSIYPSLALFRSLGRALQDRKGLARLLLFARVARTRALDPRREKHPRLREALQVAAGSERRFRRLLAAGFRRYGKEVASEEFFLRRMTHLSLSLFWLAAAVGFEKALHPDGLFPVEELDVIQYLAEESRELQSCEGNLAPSARERAHRKVMAAL
jgi:acyl-CoA dehydrogenase family protein 9